VRSKALHMYLLCSSHQPCVGKQQLLALHICKRMNLSASPGCSEAVLAV